MATIGLTPIERDLLYAIERDKFPLWLANYLNSTATTAFNTLAANHLIVVGMVVISITDAGRAALESERKS